MVIWKWKWNNLPTKRRINSPRNDIHFRCRSLCRPFSLYAICCLLFVAVADVVVVALSPFSVYVMLLLPLLLLFLSSPYMNRNFLLCFAVTDTCFVLNYADVGIWFDLFRGGIRDEFLSNQCTYYKPFTHEISIINLAAPQKPSNW